MSRRDRLFGVRRHLGSDRVFGWIQTGLSATLVARKSFERNVVRVLSGANIPTHQDLDRLFERVQMIDDDLDDAVQRIERLARRMDALQRRQ